jgi:rhodanese-related sulfurtransferase
MKKKLATTVAVIIGLVVMKILASMAMAQEIPKITKEEVKAMLDDTEVIIVDVRLGGDWDGSKSKIKGAVREDPRNVSSWVDKYPKEKTLIFYCA